MTKQDMSVFGLDEDDVGIEFGDFTEALMTLITLGGARPVREVGDLFDLTDDVVRAAVKENGWLFLTGPDDDPTKQMIEVDGE